MNEALDSIRRANRILAEYAARKWPLVAAPLPAAPAPTEQQTKQVIENIEQLLGELPPLPTSFTQVARLDGTMCDAFTPNQMHGYARAALAHQLSRIWHLEHERDTARKDCTALVARQAPAEALKELTPSDMPVLPQHLLNIIGDYGLARTDGLSELQRLHLWETLIAAIKNYAWATRQAPDSRDACLHKWELRPAFGGHCPTFSERCTICYETRPVAVAQEKAQ